MAASTPLYSVVDKTTKKNRSPVERKLEEDSPASATFYALVAADVTEQPATTRNEGVPSEYSVITSHNIRAEMDKQHATTKIDSEYSMTTLDSIRADMYQDTEQENSRIASKPNNEQTNKWVSYKSLACIFPTIIAAIAILISIISIAYFSGEIAKLKTPPASGQLLQQIQQNVSDAMGERDSILHRLNSSETLYQQLVHNVSDAMGERDSILHRLNSSETLYQQLVQNVSDAMGEQDNVLQNLTTSINKIQATLDNQTPQLNTSIDQLVNSSETLYQQLVQNVSDAMRKQNNILQRLNSSERLYQQFMQSVSDAMAEQDNVLRELTSIDESTSIDQLVNRLNSSDTLYEQLVHNISVLENRAELCRCEGRRR